MAKCGMPLAVKRSFYKTGATTCGAKGRYEIIFQGKPRKVCKVHRGYNGRESLN